ncbi:hypothetical protein L7F22_010512 [Adiantum nelumboides]|nr:hypothetical protein [Adiantum nelumboides]
MFATKAIVLYLLSRKDVKFIWTLECQESFQALKDAVSSKPILRQLNSDVIFHVHVDASGVVMGAILAQPDGKADYPVYFASRRFSMAEQGYSTTEREALQMVFSATKFRHYLLGKLFHFYVDHQALLYLINKVVIQGRLIRWMKSLMEFEFKIFHKPGKSHCGADHLSKNTEASDSQRPQPPLTITVAGEPDEPAGSSDTGKRLLGGSDLARFYAIRVVPSFTFFKNGSVIKHLCTRDRQRLQEAVCHVREHNA